MNKKIWIVILLAILVIIFKLIKVKSKIYDYIEKDTYIVKEKILDSIDETSEANNNEIIIRKDNKFGVSNIKGDIILNLAYDYILRINTNLYFIQNGQNKSLYHTKLKKVVVLDEMDIIKDDLYRIIYKNKYRLVDNNLEEIFNEENNFIDGNDKNILIFNEKSISLYNENKEIRELKNQYEKIKLGIGKNLYAKKNNLWGIIDNNETILIDFKYDSFMELNDKDILIGYIGDESYLINLQSSSPLEIKLDYDNYGMESYDKIMVLKDGKIGYINTLGKQIIEPKYDGGFAFKKDKNFIQVKNVNKWEILDLNGNKIKELDVNDLGEYVEGYMLAEKNGKYGYINEKGEIKIPLEYDYAEVFKNNLAIVANDYGYGIINKENKLIFPLKYDKVEIFKDYIYVIKDEKYGVFSNTGKEIIPIEFDHLNKITDKIIFFKQNKKSGLIELIREEI